MVKLESVIRVRNDKYYIAGGYKVVNNGNPFQNLMKIVSSSSVNKPLPMFKTNYVERELLPRIFPASFYVIDTEMNQIKITTSLLYHLHINVYVALFKSTVDLTNKDNVKSFIRNETPTFVLNINPSMGYTFTTPNITRVYHDIENSSNSSDVNDADEYVVVMYASPIGTNGSTKYDAFKTIHFTKNDYTPPEIHRFAVELVN